MENILKYFESHDLKRLESNPSGVVTLDDSSANFLHIVTNPQNIDVKVTSRDRASSLIVLHSEGDSELDVTIEDGALLNIIDVYVDAARCNAVVTQGRGSTLNSTILELSASSVNCIVNLNGVGSNAEVNMLQLVSKSEHANISLRMAHNAANCTSQSTSKCAASGESIGEFHGLIYVAEGAQRTVSQQNSRNIALSADAKIIAEPQLEIYADDVKCAHGATVGQMNKDAILYMRQRGLSEEMARKLQLDGFISEITNRCGVESLRDALSEIVRDHLQTL